MDERVLVLGAGFGGLELCTMLSEEFGGDVDVTLIEKSDASSGGLMTVLVNRMIASKFGLPFDR